MSRLLIVCVVVRAILGSQDGSQIYRTHLSALSRRPRAEGGAVKNQREKSKFCHCDDLRPASPQISSCAQSPVDHGQLRTSRAWSAPRRIVPGDWRNQLWQQFEVGWEPVRSNGAVSRPRIGRWANVILGFKAIAGAR